MYIVEMILKGNDLLSPTAIKAAKAAQELGKEISKAEKEADKFNALIGKSKAYEEAQKNIDSLAKKHQELKKIYDDTKEARTKERSEISKLEKQYNKEQEAGNEKAKETLDIIKQKKEAYTQSLEPQKKQRELALDASKALEKEHKALAQTSEALKKAGVDTNKLADEQKRLAESSINAAKSAEKQKSIISKAENADKRRVSADRMIMRAAFLGQAGDTLSGIGKGIFGVAAAPAKTAMSIETAQANLGATVGARLSSEDRMSLVRPMREQAERLAKEQGISVAEVMSGQDVFAKAGLKVSANKEKNEVMGAMDTALGFSKAGDVGMSEAAGYLVQGKAIFGGDYGGDTKKSFTAISDALVAGADASLLNVGDFGIAFRYSAEQAKKMGMDVNKTASWLSVLGGKGFTGETAGTGFRAVLASLTAGGEQKKILGSLGVNVSKDGKIRELSDILADLKGSFSKNKITDEEQMMLMGKLFGREASGVAMALMEASKPKNIAEIAGENKIDKTALKSMESSVTSEKSKIELKNIGIDSFKNQDELFIKLSAKMQNLGEKQQGEVLKNVFGQNAEKAKVILDSMPASFKLMLENIKGSEGVTEKKAKVKSETSEVNLEKLKASWEIFSSHMGEKLIPILNQAVNIAANVVGYMDKLVTTHPMIAKIMGGVGVGVGGLATIGGAALGLASGAASIAGGMKFLGIIGAAEPTKVSGLMSTIISGSKGLITKIPSIGATIFGGIKNHIPGAIGLFKTFGSSIMSLASVVFPILKTGIISIGRALLMNPIGIAVGLIAGAGYLVYKNWEPIKNFFGNLWDGIKEKWSEFFGWVGEKWNSFKDMLSIFAGGGKEALFGGVAATALAMSPMSAMGTDPLPNLLPEKISSQNLQISNEKNNAVNVQMPVNIHINGNADPKEIEKIFLNSVQKNTNNIFKNTNKDKSNGSKASFFDEIG